MKPFFIKIYFAVLLLLAQTALADDAKALQNLQQLVGSWKLANPQSPREAAFRLKYHFIAKNSALVETYGNPAADTTQTVFHLHNGRIMATHYCARGNQPRLAEINSADSQHMVFEFFDITNLKNKSDPHMVGMEFRFNGADQLEKDETYLAKGEKQTSTMRLIRE